MASSSSAKFKVDDMVRISKTRQPFDKGYLPNWTEQIVGLCVPVFHFYNHYKVSRLLTTIN